MLQSSQTNEMIPLLRKADIAFCPTHELENCCHYKINDQARGYKTFFMLNSLEHEILTANKC